MNTLAMVILGVAAVAFLVGIGALASVRSRYYDAYGSASSSRPDFFTVAFAEHRSATLVGVVALVAGFVGLIAFGLVMRP